VSAALCYARRLLREDPLQESSYRLLMRLYASLGDRAAALRVYRLCAEVLQRELGVDPSSATTILCERIRRGEEVVPNNLPQPVSRFVGRQRELGEIRRALEHARLVTLVGAGGCGKTRLALQVASQALLEFPDGVWWADLALAADDGLIPSLVATAMGLREQPPRPLPQLISDFLKDRQALLVLDNCEHLLEGCAELTVALLRGARSLRILATSREPLRVEGEWVYRVPPMETPPADAVADWDRWLGCESVQLFVERARASGYMTLQPDDAGVIAEICRRLDGLPLAIELAAARACGMPLREIARQLLDRFALLGDGAGTARSRHRTLKAALDWSYEMLGSSERALLRRLSVLSGSWTLEAAEGICAGPEVEREEVASGVAQLVSRSLVVWERPAQARYRLLETVREYARLKLIESGEAEELGRRHRDWYLGLAERAGPNLTGPEQDAWFRRLDEELSNLRAALRWSLEHGDPEAELRLASALGQFWARRGWLSEGRSWLAEGLRCGEIPLPLRIRALVASGQLAHHEADYEAAAALLCEGLALARRCGDEEGEVEALVFLGLGATRQGSYDAARTYLLEGLRRAEQTGNLRGRALSHTGLGLLAASCGNWVEASWRYQVASEVLQAWETDGTWRSSYTTSPMRGASQGSMKGPGRCLRNVCRCSGTPRTGLGWLTRPQTWPRSSSTWEGTPTHGGPLGRASRILGSSRIGWPRCAPWRAARCLRTAWTTKRRRRSLPLPRGRGRSSACRCPTGTASTMGTTATWAWSDRALRRTGSGMHGHEGKG